MPGTKTKSSGRGMISILVVVGLVCLSMFRFSTPITKKFTATIIEKEDISSISVPASNHGGNQKSTAKDSARITTQMQTQTQTQTHETNAHKKPLKFFAIHIGPSKTGTSAIQKDLARNPFEVNTLGEDKDNVIYVGKRKGIHWPDPNKASEIRKINGTSFVPSKEQKFYESASNCMMKELEEYYENSNSNRATTKNRLENDEETRASLRQTLIDTCWGEPKRYMLDYSIVDSEESYSYRRENLASIGTRFELFNILGYERLVVVAAYRRYADWIVSSFTQLTKRCLSDNLEGLGGYIHCTSFEDFLTGSHKDYNIRFYQNIHVTLPVILEAGPSKMEAKILNYFQLPKVTSATSGVKTYNSITTELYCDAFGKDLTPHTCSHALEVERNSAASKKSSSLVTNKGEQSDGAYLQIVNTAFRLGFIVLTDEEFLHPHTSVAQTRLERRKKKKPAAREERKTKKASSELRKELDEITSHGKFTIVGTNSSNITTYKALSQHHKRVCNNRAWTKSLPMKCPSIEQLNIILRQSLAFEELVMPEFYATPLGRQEHERLFWESWHEEKKRFCWVDTDRLFQNATSWDEIINERMVNYDWDVSYAAGNKTGSQRTGS